MPFGIPNSIAQYQGQRSGVLPGAYNPNPPPVDLGWLRQYLDDQAAQAQAAQDPGYYDTGSGGGGGVVAAAAPAYDPAADPSYQQLLAQLGLSESQARTTATQRIGEIGAEGAIAGPRIQEAGVQQRQGINNTWEGRGLFRGGARLHDLALQQRGESEKLADNTRSIADKTAAVNQDLQDKLDAISQQKAQAAFSATLKAS